MFEPVHGSAPDIAGQQKADPTAAILSDRPAARSPRAARTKPAASPARSRRTSPTADGTPAPPPRSATRSSPGSRRNLDIAARTAAHQRRTRHDPHRIDPDTGLAPLEFAVTKNLAAKKPAQRDEILAEPRLRHELHRPHGRHLLVGRRRLAPPARPAVRPDLARPRRRGAALRPGDLRGHQGLPPRGRLDPHVPPRPERPPPAALRAAPRAARAAGRRTSSSRCASSSPSTAPGCRPAQDQSLYLRPFMFAKEAFLGVRPAQKVAYYVIASPAGAYFKGGVKPVSIWLSEDYSRAGKGGTGAAKTGGNYAASPAAAVRGVRERMRPGRLPRPGPQRRRARRHERRVRLQGRHDRHPAVRRRSSRASRATRSCSSPRTAATRSRAARSRSTSGARAWHPATSSRCSRAAPPPSSRRSALLKGKDFLDEQPHRRARAVAARGAHRHPVRPPRGQARLAAAPRRADGASVRVPRRELG